MESRAAPCLPEAIRPTTATRRRAEPPPNQLLTGAVSWPGAGPEASAGGAAAGRGARSRAPHRPMPAARASMAAAWARRGPRKMSQSGGVILFASMGNTYDVGLWLKQAVSVGHHAKKNAGAHQ